MGNDEQCFYKNEESKDPIANIIRIAECLLLILNCSFPTRFGNQSSIGNLHLMRDCFDHIINGECCHCRSGQGLHFNSCFMCDTTHTINHNFFWALKVNINLDLIQWQWMTQWNQITCLSANDQKRRYE